MKICADACPVTRIVVDTARRYAVPVVLPCGTNHVLTSDCSAVKPISAGPGAVDIALIDILERGYIAVTQDCGEAAPAPGKGARATHQSGREYTNGNTEGLLMERHTAGKARWSGRRRPKGPPRRTEEDDRRFAESFERMIREAFDDRGTAE